VEQFDASIDITSTGTLTPTAVVTGTSVVTPSVSAAATLTTSTTITGTPSITATGTVTGTTGTTTGPRSETVKRWRIKDDVLKDDLTVGPTVGNELLGRAFLAILAASVALLIYLTLVFRKVPNAFRYGVCAVIAVLHDV